jgi:DNA-binding CsgD family transcriptional regulator
VITLTLRQRRVLTMAASGRTNLQIARDLGVTTGSVQRYLTETYRELGAQDRANAVAVAIHLGIISLADIARIADAAAARAAAAVLEAAGAAVSASQPAGAVRDVRGGDRAAGGRTGPREGAAA